MRTSRRRRGRPGGEGVEVTRASVLRGLLDREIDAMEERDGKKGKGKR
jgi:hypothetical protein